jgi:hypothetical protein
MRYAITVPTPVAIDYEAAEGGSVLFYCVAVPILGMEAFFHFLIIEPCSILEDMAGGEVAEWPNAAVC